MELVRNSKEGLIAKRFSQKAIYGVDSRIEVSEVDDDRIRGFADAVGAVFYSFQLPLVNGRHFIKTHILGEFLGLCKSERFFNQHTGSVGTCFLVADDIVATAGHVAPNSQSQLDNFRVYFGYEYDSYGVLNTEVSTDEVFKGVEIIERVVTSAGPDFALIRLDRKVKNRSPLLLDNDRPRVGDGVFIIGHPVGIPKKYANEAVVRATDSEDYFVANLDAFGGNSGSPVFRHSNMRVTGILVRGDTDFQSAIGSDCKSAMVCPTTGCLGEDCQYIDAIGSFL